MSDEGTGMTEWVPLKIEVSESEVAKSDLREGQDWWLNLKVSNDRTCKPTSSYINMHMNRTYLNKKITKY
jgi:hypothetical protein